MASKPALLTRGLSNLSASSDANSPAEQRDDAKRNFLKAMRPLPTQHYWNVFFEKPSQKDSKKPAAPAGAAGNDAAYQQQLEQLGQQIESVQDFWRYNNNTPVEQIKMRESLYLFKEGFRPVWEDRRNFLGGSWTFRVPKNIGPDFWTRVQLLAIGETLQAAIDEADQICGVGLSVRFNLHLISIWHRDSAKQKSIDGILEAVLEGMPPELRPKAENYFYKRHQDHSGFKVPPELQVVLDSRRKAEEANAKAASDKAAAPAEGEASTMPKPDIIVEENDKEMS